MASIANHKVGPTGYGLMGFTWRENPVAPEKAYAAMHKALELGANFWNGGEIYGSPERNSLHLLNEYFTKYPEDASKVAVSIKGGNVPGQVMMRGDEENIKRSIEECLKVLDGKVKLSIFEMARVDKNVPIEDTIGYIAKYVERGQVGGIGLSEVSAETIRRAAKIHKIAAVEVEFSMWSRDILENGIASTCAELGIPIIAYSPLGRGYLTGQYTNADHLDPRYRGTLPRVEAGNLEKNLKIVDKIKAIAADKGCTPAQLAVAWVKFHSGRNGLPTIIPIPGASSEARVQENMADVALTQAEYDRIDEMLKQNVVAGDRYGGHGAAQMNG